MKPTKKFRIGIEYHKWRRTKQNQWKQTISRYFNTFKK